MTDEWVQKPPPDLRQRQAALLTELEAELDRPLQAFADQVVQGVAQVFDAEYCKVLELLPGSRELLLRAGVGWLPGLVGVETVGTEHQSQAGYTLLRNQPIIVENLPQERRFSGPPLLHLHRVVSGLSVVIPGEAHRVYGVLGVHSTRYVPFDQEDARFLEAVAGLVAKVAMRSGHPGVALERSILIR